MQAPRPRADLLGSQARGMTPAERAEQLAAVQARLKSEAAARRAGASRAARSEGSKHATRGRQRSGR
jgi:hypothetical protein